MSKTDPKGKSVDYEIGYKRPPISGRFKRGDVGNPKGRPRKKKTVGQTIDEVTATRIRIAGNSKSHTILEIIIRNLAHAAAKGDIRAINTLFNLKGRYQDSEDTTLDPADLAPEDRKIVEEYLARLQPKTSPNNTSEPDDAAKKDKGTDGEDDGEPNPTPGDEP
jgi:hypothetical protein